MAGAASMPVSRSQALPAPGTEAAYPGSRRFVYRYGYKENSLSGLVELHPERLLTREEFKANLLAAPGVLKVSVFPKIFVVTGVRVGQLGFRGVLGGPPAEEPS